MGKRVGERETYFSIYRITKIWKSRLIGLMPVRNLTVRNGLWVSVTEAIHSVPSRCCVNFY